jgi:GNAT superfamily N-acetyltransferase
MELLDKVHYSKLTTPVSEVPFNNLFARAVIEKMVSGKVYVDNPINIKTAYIVHPYGMTLLTGDCDNKDFNEQFRKYALNIDGKRNSFEWMQTYPESWNNKIQNLFGEQLIPSDKNISKIEKGIIELNTRVNFKFDKASYLVQKTDKKDPNIKIVKTDRQMFRQMNGSVVPKYFWDNEDDFFNNGMAYGLLYNGELAAMSFSSYKFGDQFELGIETNPDFRGKGLAQIVCSALIDYCIEKNHEPIWACRKENIGSYKLALKLGFHPAAELPYYRLSN